MYNELTEVDLKKMREEIEYRTCVLRPKLIEDVKTAREFGDLSENFEYKAAKQEKNRNDSRIRYLRRMISTAKVISAASAADVVGLFDKVEIRYEDTGETETLHLVTTLRQNSLEGRVSKESPIGRALFGRRVGEEVAVQTPGGDVYSVRILSLEKGADDENLEIRKY